MLFIAFGAALPGTARADCVLYLKNGETIRAESCLLEGRMLRLKIKGGSLSFPAGLIKSIKENGEQRTVESYAKKPAPPTTDASPDAPKTPALSTWSLQPAPPGTPPVPAPKPTPTPAVSQPLIKPVPWSPPVTG